MQLRQFSDSLVPVGRIAGFGETEASQPTATNSLWESHGTKILLSEELSCSSD